MSYATLCNDLEAGEIAAIRLLQRYGVVQKMIICDQGHDMKLYSKTGKGKDREGDVVWRWQCNKRECRGPGKKRVNLRTNNWLAGTKMPHCALIRFIWLWSRKYSNKAIVDELQMSSHSVVDFKNWLREVCTWRVLCKQAYHKLGGKGERVEVDESVFSKRKNHKGRIVARTVGAWRHLPCPEPLLPGTGSKSQSGKLQPLLEKYIHQDSIVITDEWKGYCRVKKYFKAHYTVNHSRNFVNPINGAHTQNIERFWRNPKDEGRSRRGTHKHHLKSNLAEYMWHKMLREDHDPFEEILKHIGKFWPPGAAKHQLEYRIEPLHEDDSDAEDSGESSDSDGDAPPAQVSEEGLASQCNCITELGEACKKCAECHCNNGAGEWCFVCASNDDL